MSFILNSRLKKILRKVFLGSIGWLATGSFDFHFPLMSFRWFLKSLCIPAWLLHMDMKTEFKCPERKGFTEIFHKTCGSRQLIYIWFLLITMKCFDFSLLAWGVTQMVWFDISSDDCVESLQQGCDPNVRIVMWERLYGSLLFCRQISRAMPSGIYSYCITILYVWVFLRGKKK